jgi:epsilon-lactone hydrolase
MPSLQARVMRLLVRLFAPDLHHERSVESIRADLDRAAHASKPPIGTTKRRLFIGDMEAEWITPAGESRGVLLYLHGGAYIAGSIVSHSNTVAYFADVAGVEALLPAYRLAPEHPFPAALDDAVAAYRWLLAQGRHPDELVIAGDSAGGGLTLATLVYLRDARLPLPAAAICLSAWTDLAATGSSLRTRARKEPWLRAESVVPGAAHYYSDQSPRHPLISPLYADLAALPPILMQVGDYEILLDDTLRVAEKIRAVGGVVEVEVWNGMWHVFQAFTNQLPESRAAVASIGEFIRSYVKQLAQTPIKGV